MASPLEDSTLEVQRSVIRFLVVEGVETKWNIFKNTNIIQKKLHESYEYIQVEIKNGRTSMGEKTQNEHSVEVSGYPLESRIDGLICDYSNNNNKVSSYLTDVLRCCLLVFIKTNTAGWKGKSSFTNEYP